MSFNFSFRIYHPSLNANVIIDDIGLRPKFHWSCGEVKRDTPKGVVTVESPNEETYVTFPIDSKEPLIEHAIGNFVDSIFSKKNILLGYIDDGARVELFVGFFCEKNDGFILASKLLGRLSDLGIGVAFDIYGSDY